VCPAFGHFEREFLDMLAVDEMDFDNHPSSSSPLNFNWETTHSCGSTSLRTPR
jgi:hypothetical protein